MPVVWIPILAAILGILTLIGAGPMAAELGGWKRLAEFYQAGSPFGGRKRLASGGMGLASYGFSLLLGADAQGFSMEATGVVFTGHAPLFIPWDDIQAKEVSGWGGFRVFVEFSKTPGIVLRLKKKTVLKLKEMSGSPLAFPGIV